MKKIFFSSLLVLLTMVGIVPRLAAQEEGTPQYGVELLTNIPPAATNFTGWTTSGSVECKEGWFKTGNSVSTISQTIDLAAKGYTTPVAENTFFIYAAAEYCEYWGGSARGVAKVYVEFLDENGNVLAADYVLNRENYSGYVDITRVSNKFVIPANTTKVRYVLQGKDQMNWGGCYGPWFRNMSCKVFDYTKVGTSINVSLDAALGDSITLSKTSDFLYGDTVTVTAKYPEHPILWITSNEGQLLEDNQLICWGTDIVVGAQLKYDHTISLNATHATIISDTTKAGMGDTITLSYTMEEGYYFVEYTTDVEVDWIDANRFIMPDANITIGVKFIAPNALPYFEGFENGNSQDAHIEGWAWQTERNNDWLANTSNTVFNQTPYEGSWNATLEFNNAAWLFQAFTFEKGKKYCISFYARTYDSATLRVMLGNSNHKDSMQVTLIPNTSISNGNYKKISGAIKVEKDGNYVIGIRGYMNSARNALSIDNVVVEEAQAHAITLNGMHATLTADKASAYIGDTVTLSSSMEYGYALGRYTTNINVTWIDANRFIMPDENVAVGNTAITVKSLPYFEGFEDGNTQGSVVADWLQQSENGSNSWVANSTNTNYNRTPYAGSWNAYLYGYNTDWLFQALTLEAGKTYAFSMRARSYYSAKILVKLGNQTNKDAMSVTIVPETTLSTTDYQYLSGKFTVETTGIYVIGIRGYSTNSSNYTSIDNIQVREAQPHAITLNGTHATLTADKTEASIGDTVTLSYTFDENYVWGNYTTNINVTWIDDHRFIMPDEDVVVGNVAITPKSLPYFEGFENGNTQDAVIADWLQQSEYGDAFWGANSTNIDFNRTPYAGSRWNATLLWGNTDWLFQAIALEAGENYVLSLYARQDMQDPSYANITAALGTAFNKDAMTTTLIPETGLTNGDYQLLTDTFQVAETKPYVLGIRGYISGSPYYISMDNILVEQEVYPASVDTLYFDVLTEDAARTALAALSLPAQDTKVNTKCTITNLPENWVLDLENKKATYTAADSLLPVGYFFSNTTATITVALQLNTYSLSFATNDAAMGSVSSTHEADTYNYGTEITLTATPNEGCHFVQWSDGTTSATYTFTLTGDTTLTATFAIDQHTITVTAGENGTVKMEVNDEETAETVFDYGTEITLTAIPDEGYYFVDWSDGSWTTPYVFTIKKDCELTANFALTQYGMELLSNIPPVATDLKRWVATSEANDCVPICSEGWYKTGRYTGIISQTIDLAAKGYNMPIAENTLLLYAAAEYFVGWTSDASGIAKVYVEFLDAENNVLSTNYVLNRTGQFGTVDITLVEDMFMVPANTTQVRYVLEGCDQCGWGGYFGTWFRNMSCKLLEATKIGNPINVSVAETLGDSLTLSKIADFRYGDTITVIPTYSQHPIIWLAVNEGRIINNNQVVCLGENIIISAELMSHKSVPYFEGFENGNAQDYKVAGWLLQSEQGDGNWSANNTGTSDNRSPYDGSWNATLSKGNTNWLFQALTLEADETYVLSLYARQTYSNTKAATITAALGDAFNKEAMTDTLITETGVNATYKQLTDTFQVSESKVYVLGIRGYISMSSWALAMDNIMVEQKVYPATITTPLGLDDLTEDAARTALATLSLTAVDTKGNTKCAITNLPVNWVLDLENKKATYSVVGNLLPKGYYSDEVTITVTFIQNTPTQLSETNAETKVEKVLRNGQVFIIRNGNTYDLTGRKAE